MWGLLHAIYQIVGDMRRVWAKKHPAHSNAPRNFSYTLRKRLGTFILVDFAWIFFAASSFSAALRIIRQMFTTFQTTSIYSLGLSRGDWFFLLFPIAILMIVDTLHERGVAIFKLVNQQECWLRWLLYLGLVWTIIMFGIYGTAYDSSQFIYFQF
ncbi:MAG: MBOAT family protein, partial [Clostridia bacterium]|nr:MBOAT family protein [Clostridia bacterium]